jgi:TolB-like protein/Tfp pilus assembly protein PilF
MHANRDAIVRFGLFELDLRSRELRQGARCVRLQEQPFEILRAILSRPGDVVTREELQQALWPGGTFVDYEHSLNAAVRRLRSALDDDADRPRYIETLPRRGYRFIAAVEEDGARAEPLAPAVAAARLAVLPFTVLDTSPGYDYFTDGLTEELIAQIGRAGRGRIAVIARGSSMAFKGSSQRAQTIGQALGADYLLEGSVRRDSDRVRIVVRLIDTSTEAALWVETYDRPLTESLSLQADVAARTARSLAVELGARLPARAVAADVLMPCLKGRHKWHQRTEAGFRAAVKLFEEAIGHDPTYAPAYVGLAESLAMLANYGIVSPNDVRTRALGAVRRALEFDPTSADAHRALAFIHWQFEFAWQAALAEYEHALALSPNAADTVYWYGVCLGVIGWFDRSHAQLTRAAELDPLSLLVPSVQGWMRYFARKFEDAISLYQRVLTVDPDYHVALWFLGQALVELDRHDEAIAALARALELSGRSARLLGYLGYACGRAGRTAEAERLLSELDNRALDSYVPPYFPALVLSGLGRADASLDRLEQAHRQGDTMLRDLKVDPPWDRMRVEPRFRALMRELAFPGLP